MKLFLFSLALLGLSCTQTPAAAGQSKLAPDAFEQMLQKDSSAQLIDVRSPEEYQEGHLSKAENINIHDADFEAKMGRFDKNRPVLVYCAVGGRSAKAANQMSAMGFAQVFDLQGGITAWKKAGKPVEK